MRICFVSGEYPPLQGGVGDYTRELARALRQIGHQVVTVTSARAAQPAGQPSNACPPRSSNEPASQASRVTGEPDMLPVVQAWGWRCWPLVLHAARRFRCDIVHIQYQTAAFGMHPAINFLPLRLRASDAGLRCVVTFHDLRVPYLFPKAGPVRRWVNVMLARWSDAVIATNAEDCASLEGWLGHQGPEPRTLDRRTRLRHISIGSNIRSSLPEGYDRDTWRGRLGVSQDEALLCYFGFLNESKGGVTLLRVLAELVRRQRKVKLLMIGGLVGDSDPTNQAYLKRVQTVASDLGIAARTLWTGYTVPEQVSANFAAADVCILPYRDGASFRRGSFMAALAHGMPIVSTWPATPLPSLVDGENIRLVPPDDSSAAADAVEGLILSPGARKRLAQGALALAKVFSWEHVAAQTAQLYADLLSA